MKSQYYNKMIIVFVIAFITSIIGILHVLIGYAKNQLGWTYMWTGHYYLDYFYYLVPIAQGQRGYWLSFQQYATGDLSKYPHLWPYIAIGQFSRLFHLSAATVYWLTVFISIFFLVYLIFLAIKKILEKENFSVQLVVLILSLLAVPFFSVSIINGNFNFSLFEIWYSTGIFFKRFEPIPHHLLTSIFILMTFMVFASLIKKISKISLISLIGKSILAGILLAAVLSFNSYNVIVPIITVGITAFIYFIYFLFKHEFKNLLKLILFFSILGIIVGVTGFLFANYYKNSSFSVNFKETETSFHQNPGIKLLLLNIGPLLLFLPFGLYGYLKNINVQKIIFLVMVLVSYGLYLSPLDKLLGTHNGRFLTPLSYIFFGSLAVIGIKQMAGFFGKHRSFVFLLIVGVLVFIFLCVNTQILLNLVQDKNINSPISYLPKGIIEGYKYLDSKKDDKAILATPSQFLGQLMPIFIDKKVYVSRQIITPNYIEKNIRTSNFYIGAMTNKDAYDFLKENGLGYVILTSIEGYSINPLYNYPFLKEIYKNKDIVIFEVK